MLARGSPSDYPAAHINIFMIQGVISYLRTLGQNNTGKTSAECNLEIYAKQTAT